jgi:hypothetical protein
LVSQEDCAVLNKLLFQIFMFPGTTNQLVRTWPNALPLALRPLLWSLVFAAVPFVFQYTYVLNTFYHFGAVYFDAGFFANLLWHNDWLLSCPQVAADYPYLGMHFSPFLVLINGLSYIMPTHMVEFYAAFMACIYASLAAGMCYALLLCAQPKTYWSVAALGALAIGFSFNGVVMQGVWMPHFEYAIPAGIFLFLLLYKTDSPDAATLFFVLTLLMREDAGLHMAGVLVLLMGARSLQAGRAKVTKAEVVFTVVAFTYSLFAWWMTQRIRAAYGVGGGNVFEVTYSGSPAYAHLSMQLVFNRAAHILRDAPYLWTGVLISLAWTLKRKNPYWIIGFAAFIPWFILNWTAYNPNTGVLYAYYAFPFVLAMGWPPIAIVWQYGNKPPRAAVRDALAMQTALVLAGLLVWDTDGGHLSFGPSYWARWGSYTSQWDSTPAGEETDTRPIVRKFALGVSSNQTLGRVMLDDGMMSLTMGSKAQNRGLNLLKLSGNPAAANTIAYFCHSEAPPAGILTKAKQNQLLTHYRVSDAPLCLFTNRSRDDLKTLAPLLGEPQRVSEDPH